MHKCVAAAFSIAIAIGPAAAGQAGVGVQAGGAGQISQPVSQSVLSQSQSVSIGRHRQRGRRKHWSQRPRRRKRRDVGRRWGCRLVRDWRSRRQPRRCLTLNGEQHCCHDGPPCPGWRRSTIHHSATDLFPSGGSDRASAATAFDEIPGTPAAVVRACRDAVGSAAAPFGVVSVRARSAGSLRRLSRGAISAPVQVRIQYVRQGGPEIRQARIRCHLDASGKVIKLT